MKYEKEYLNEVLFPIGGIGSGSISIDGSGIFRDFEIFNRPNKGSLNGFTHFAVRVEDADGKVYTRALCGDVKKNLTGEYSRGCFSGYGYGVDTHTMNGFPHFRECELTAEFPFAEYTFSDPDFPGKVLLTAFNPLIPLDDKNSSIPAAFFRIKYINDTDSDKRFIIALSLCSPFERAYNTKFETDNHIGVHIINDMDKEDTAYGDITIACPKKDAFAQQSWYRGGWCDSVVTYWRELESGHFSDRKYDSPAKDHATVLREFVAAPLTDVQSEFVISWNIPNNYNYWNPVKDDKNKDIVWKNYYSSLFENSKETALYSLSNFEDLYVRSMEYRNAMFSSTLPDYVIEAAASTLSVLKTATVLRLEDGSFYGWEGMHERSGSCEGTCQHVWNYAYALCFLFPGLERSIRNLEFKYQTDAGGKMDFRLKLPLGRTDPNSFACLDGQMGAVIKTYREWKISGDDEWLKSNWQTIKLILGYAWSDKNPYKWDSEKNGVADGRMHHTLDMELFGASGWLEGFYLAALKAAAQMAEYLGDAEAAVMYNELFDSGFKWTKENLFNGKYFIQKVDLNDKTPTERLGGTDRYWNEETGEIKYQIGEGCDIDQLCGQWHANIIGLGRLFDEKQIESAVKSLYQNNFKKTLRNFVNPWRVFSLNDESGAVICDYPEGAYKPAIPVPYCEETMHGFEYQLAGLLISEGMIEEGMSIVKSVRDRYNGSNRNPFNEIECGSNYARSMASFALIPLLSGFVFDLPHGTIGFEPKVSKENFSCIWSLGTGWGTYTKNKNTTQIKLISGKLSLTAIKLPYLKKLFKVLVDGKEITYNFSDGTVTFEKITITDNITISY